MHSQDSLVAQITSCKTLVSKKLNKKIVKMKFITRFVAVAIIFISTMFDHSIYAEPVLCVCSCNPPPPPWCVPPKFDCDVVC